MSRLPILSVALVLALATWARPSDDDCLACHGDASLESESGRSVYVDSGQRRAGAHARVPCSQCHAGVTDYPHPARVRPKTCSACHAEAAAPVRASVHGAFGPGVCSECHGAAHRVRRVSATPGALCETCHEDVVSAYRSSIHAMRRGAGGGADCDSCHGPAHGVLASSDAASRTAKINLPDTCGSCHADPDFLARHNIPRAHPIETYRLSVHGRAVARGRTGAASCSDCHASHGVLPARDPRSKISHWTVADTCGACHTEIEKTFNESVHGQAVARGVREAPVCTDCHGEHEILAPSEPGSLVNPMRVSRATCERCHADERLAAKYNLPLDKVASFEASFHGLALRSGSQTVANCASCHGVHNILPSSDPRSTVNAANLAKTCGGCHPGAGERFRIGKVHVRAGTANEHVSVRVIRAAYLFLIIPLAIGFMTLHNAIDFVAKLVRNRPVERSGEQVQRMSLHFRVAHGLVVISFPILIVTGFALKYPESWWASPLLAFEGQFAFRAITHRIAASLLLAGLGYHLLHLLLSSRARRLFRDTWPHLQDLKDLVAMVRHNLGRGVARPHFGAMSYAEKLEYWAFMWGTAVMAASGFVLWFNNIALAFLPKWVSDAATALHFYEAVLATLSIPLWHLYMVIFDPDVYPMDRAWLTGKTSADHMRHSRPEYYARVVAEEDAGKGDETA